MDILKNTVETGTRGELPTNSAHKYTTNSTPTNTPTKYKQCYRVEWESMPHFKDWLKSVPGEPTRAFCKYCDKSLHAHRLSLLKHACTVKHTKAAQSEYAMKTVMVAKVESIAMEPGLIPDEDSQSCEETVDNPSESGEGGEEGKCGEANESGEGDDGGQDSGEPSPKVARMNSVSSSPHRSKLSTHVLDTAKGSPVGGLQVSLYKLVDSRWRILSEGFTNPDGRYSEFLQDSVLSPGRYKMHFDVDRYFVLRKQESLYPFIEIVFDVKSPHEHYHIPLLLSPYGYTTYRGS